MEVIKFEVWIEPVVVFTIIVKIKILFQDN